MLKLLNKFSEIYLRIISLNKTIIYFYLVPAVNFVTSLITTPIFAQNLSKEDFGIIGYYTAFAGQVNILYIILLPQFYLYQYHKEENNNQLLIKIVSISILWNLFFFPLSIFIAIYIANLHEFGGYFFPIGITIFLTQVLSIFKSYLQIDFRLKEEGFKYFIVLTSNKVIGILFSIMLMFVINNRAFGRQFGLLLVEIIFTIISIKLIFKKDKISIDYGLINSSLKFVLPLIPSSFLYIGLLNLDTIFIAATNSVNELGIYSIGKSIGNYFYVAFFPIFQYIEPLIYKNVKKNIYTKFPTIILICLFGCCLFCLILPFLVKFLTNNKYNESLRYAMIFSFVSAFMILFSFTEATLNALNKTKSIMYSHIFIGILGIIIYYLLTKYFGVIGAAFGSLFSFILLFTIQAILIILHKNEKTN